MNNTLKNGFRVLEFLAESGKTHSVMELAEHFSLPRSHICRLLRTLLDTGYVRQNKSRKYSIDLNILCLSHACLEQLALRKIVRPHLIRLSQDSVNGSYLAMAHHGQALIVDEVSCYTDIIMNIGAKSILHASACGKLCAAYAEPDDLDTLLKDYQFSTFTDKTIANRKKLANELAKIRKQKYSVLDGEKVNTYAFAAPIFNSSGKLIACVGFSADLDVPNKDALHEATIKIANSVSKEIN